MSMSGKRAAMSRLLDDESPVVRQAVLEEIADWKDEGLLFLNDQVKGGGTPATAAKQLLAELGWTMEWMRFEISFDLSPMSLKVVSCFWIRSFDLPPAQMKLVVFSTAWPLDARN